MIRKIMHNHQENEERGFNTIKQLNYDLIDSNAEICENTASDSEALAEGNENSRVASRQEIEGLHKLAQAMLSWIERIAPTMSGTGKCRDRRSTTSLARQIYLERARRNQFFGNCLFGEPAWDILLDLFVAEGQNELRAIKEVCISSHVPDATALRYIGQLAAMGLVKHSLDRTDLRRKFLQLTPAGRESLTAYLESMPLIGDENSDIVEALIKAD